MIKETDFLVIGTGIAGLSFALKTARHSRVLLVTKTNINETNTRYAQGGIAAVTYKPDNFEKHIKDTLIAGDGLCDKKVVEMVVREAPAKIKELAEFGVHFDKNNEGKYDLGREGGHSEHRVLHHKDMTGYEVQRVLTKKVKEHPNIEVLEHHFVVDILTQHHLGKKVKREHNDIACYGAYVFDMISDQVITVLSKVTLMATGGSGNIYMTTTNPSVATGDGIAMTYRAKGLIENMEFVQFHPTALYNPGEQPTFLITEALRGFGGILKNIKGEKFMNKYDKRGSLAPRDIVARAMDHEIKVSGDDHVYLDCTHLEADKLKSHFPNIYERCFSLNIDITKDMIPVIPAAHYQCGGIKVDMNGQSSINRLYAAGEVSCTGLHGANRLASNSLIEAIVYANNAAEHALGRLKDINIEKNLPQWEYTGIRHPEEMVVVTQNFKEMQQIMSNYVGIVRSNLRLERALRRLEIIYEETEQLYKISLLSKQLCELRNLINVGYLIIKMAKEMKDNRGLHYNIDY